MSGGIKKKKWLFSLKKATFFTILKFLSSDYLVSQVRNTAYGAREGESKSLPRGEGFRVRVTCTQKCVGLKAFELVITLK